MAKLVEPYSGVLFFSFSALLDASFVGLGGFILCRSLARASPSCRLHPTLCVHPDHPLPTNSFFRGWPYFLKYPRALAQHTWLYLPVAFHLKLPARRQLWIHLLLLRSVLSCPFLFCSVLLDCALSLVSKPGSRNSLRLTFCPAASECLQQDICCIVPSCLSVFLSCSTCFALQARALLSLRTRSSLLHLPSLLLVVECQSRAERPAMRLVSVSFPLSSSFSFSCFISVLLLYSAFPLRIINLAHKLLI